MLFSLLLLIPLAPACDDGSSPASSQLTASTQSAPADASPPLDRRMRILLLSGQRTAAINLRSAFNVVDSTSGEILRADEPPASIDVVFTSRGIEIPALELETQADALELVPTSDEPSEIRLETDWRDFPGSIRLSHRADGGAVINLMDVEEYLVGVVASELPASFHRETFRAQAIAARTYAWYARQTTGLKRDWDVWATERSQVYAGLERQRLVPQAADAVRDTRGIVCTWTSPIGEKIFCTYFSSRCGGTTAAASRPSDSFAVDPLCGGVECEYCRRPDAYQWPQEPRFAKQLVRDRLVNRYTRFAGMGAIDRVEVVEATSEGRALRIAVSDWEGRTEELDGENFRLTVDPTGRLIRSTLFEIVDEPEEILLVGGRGLGHGMGLCQYGADALARAGRRAPAILAHYYPGSRLTRAY